MQHAAMFFFLVLLTKLTDTCWS